MESTPKRSLVQGKNNSRSTTAESMTSWPRPRNRDEKDDDFPPRRRSHSVLLFRADKSYLLRRLSLFYCRRDWIFVVVVVVVVVRSRTTTTTTTTTTMRNNDTSETRRR
jgi:hypothetical protein